MKGECLRGVGRRRIKIQISGRVFGSHQEGFWRRREEVGKSERTKKIRVRRKNNRGIYSRVQEGSKRKWI